MIKRENCIVLREKLTDITKKTPGKPLVKFFSGFKKLSVSYVNYS